MQVLKEIDFLLKLLKGKESDSIALAHQMLRDICQELVLSVDIKPVFKLSNLDWTDFSRDSTLQFQVPEDGKRRFRILIALVQEFSKSSTGQEVKPQFLDIQRKAARLFWIALCRYRDLGWLELGIVFP
jgi:hypothetical protein